MDTVSQLLYPYYIITNPYPVPQNIAVGTCKAFPARLFYYLKLFFTMSLEKRYFYYNFGSGADNLEMLTIPNIVQVNGFSQFLMVWAGVDTSRYLEGAKTGKLALQFF